MNDDKKITIEIYKITNKANGKCYIGQTRQGLIKRFNQHCKKKDSPLGRAIRKYGKDNFCLEIIDTASSEKEANELEHNYILENCCIVPDGYNLNEYGRLVGTCKTEYCMAIKPQYVEWMCELLDLKLKILILLTKHTNKDFYLKVNYQVYVTTLSTLNKRLAKKLGSSDKTIRTAVKICVENSIILLDEETGRYMLNPEMFKLIY